MGLNIYSAIESTYRFIITERTGDFHFSEIQVLKARNFFENYVASKK